MGRVTSLPPAHAFLRRATERQHRLIDRTSVLAVLTTPGVTVDLYRQAMQSLQLAYREIDFLLLDSRRLCPADLPDYSPRLPGIDRDLKALDARSDEHTVDPPRARIDSILRTPATEAAYLGMRYVVEGAQLGSRVIYGHLYAVFGAQLGEFGSFWRPVSAVPSTWPGVLKSLARLDSRDSLANAVRAARRTFRHMEAYLTP